MKKTILILALSAAMPFAFAQTSSTSTTTQDTATGSSMTTTTSTNAAGTVTTFQPGSTIVVRQEGMTDPVSYALGKTVQYVNRAGRTIEASMIHPGVPVHVYYDNAGETHTVTKVVVDQD